MRSKILEKHGRTEMGKQIFKGIIQFTEAIFDNI